MNTAAVRGLIADDRLDIEPGQSKHLTTLSNTIYVPSSVERGRRWLKNFAAAQGTMDDLMAASTWSPHCERGRQWRSILAAS